MFTVNPQQEDTSGYAPTRGHDETPTDEHNWVKGAGRQLQLPPEEKQKGGRRKPEQADQEAGRHAARHQHYAELDFADRGPIPPPSCDMFIVAYAEVGQA